MRTAWKDITDHDPSAFAAPAALNALRTVPAAAAAPEISPPPAQPGTLVLAFLTQRRDGGGWMARIAGQDTQVAVDPSVDPALLDDCLARGARVVVEGSAPPTVVGTLATARAVTVDEHGDVHIKARRFTVAADDLLLAAAGAFVQVKLDEVEIYGRRVAARAREVARLLGRMIKLN